MRRLFCATVIAAALALPVKADEVSDTIAAALEAYEAGDLKLASEELAFAKQLVDQQKAEGLSAFFPDALPGDEKTIEAPQNVGAFGGGQIATVRYEGPDGDVDITLTANNAMVASMGQLFGNTALMGTMGKVTRIGRQKLVISNDGEIQGMIGNVFMQVGGDAPVEKKRAYVEQLPFGDIADF